jgi:hypothetical protein
MCRTRSGASPAGIPAAVTKSGRAEDPRTTGMAWVAVRNRVLATPITGMPNAACACARGTVAGSRSSRVRALSVAPGAGNYDACLAGVVGGRASGLIAERQDKNLLGGKSPPHGILGREGLGTHSRAEAPVIEVAQPAFHRIDGLAQNR